tara:strand:+ start:1873 stop:2418 length:546 start_codon:yes stop_codon:yes gene_type:complete
MTSETIPALLGLIILYYFTSYTPRKSKREEYKNISELADSMLKSLEDATEEKEEKDEKEQENKSNQKKISPFQPMRIKSNPDVRLSVAYKKDGTEAEATANGAGWATCADSSRTKDVQANREKAIELCEEWHKSNTPHMSFGNNSGEFVCKVVNESLDAKGDESRAKACPYMRIVSKDIVN